MDVLSDNCPILFVAAYRGLARSRGVSLEHVVRAACVGELADVVRRPTVTPATAEGAGNSPGPSN